MVWDIVFPQNNEKEFANAAEAMGYEGLICIYPNGAPSNMPKTSMPLVVCKDMKKATDKLRRMIEMKKAKLIYSVERLGKKDYIHHRGGGMNQVLTNLMKKKEIALGFSFANLLHIKPYERGLVEGRMQLNIKLCRKYKVPMVVGSFATRPYELRASHDLKAYFSQLGMHPKEITDGRKYLDRFL